MIGAQNSLNLNCKVCVMKEAPGPSVSEEIADIFTNYNIDTTMQVYSCPQADVTRMRTSGLLTASSHCGDSSHFSNIDM